MKQKSEEIDVEELQDIGRIMYQSNADLYYMLKDDPAIADYIPDSPNQKIPKEIYEYVNDHYVAEYVNYRDKYKKTKDSNKALWCADLEENLRDRIKFLRDVITLSNMGGVVMLVNKMHLENSPVDKIGMLNNATLGIIDALNDFNPNKGNNFMTYAITKIERRIHESRGVHRDSGQAFPNPQAYYRYLKARKAYYKAIEVDKDPRTSVAEALGIKDLHGDALDGWIARLGTISSLDELIDEYDDSLFELATADKHISDNMQILMEVLDNTFRSLEERSRSTGVLSVEMLRQIITLMYVDGHIYTSTEIAEIVKKSTGKSITRAAVEDRIKTFKKEFGRQMKIRRQDLLPEIDIEV